MSLASVIAQAPAPPDTVLEMQKEMEERMISDLPYLAPLGCLVVAALGGIVLALVLPASRQQLVAWFVAAWHGESSPPRSSCGRWPSSARPWRGR
jgi:hypothetical protein